MKKSILFPAVFITLSLQLLTLNTSAQPQLWGMTQLGGQDNLGVIFKTDSAANSETVQQSFLFSHQGANPQHSSLVQAADGKLYGMTYSGGANNYGVIFQFDQVSNTYTKKIDMIYANGNNPYGSLTAATDGKLYGMTNSGGANGGGVIFQYNPISNTYIKKIDFTSPTGWVPCGSLMQASDGMLYGMTSQGGATSNGVIFQYNPITNTYAKKIDLIAATGNYPVASLIQASDGMLYGMTYIGGANNSGVIFQYNPVTVTYTKEIDLNAANGSNPYGSLMQASDGMLYGVTIQGGTNNLGVLFQYDPLANTYTKKIDFNGTANGSRPFGSLMQASDGMIYGMTSLGGTNNLGVLFLYDPSADNYIKKIDYNGAVNGSNPNGTLMQASDGKLYGMTSSGGGNAVGIIFQYSPSANTYIDKFDFDLNNGSRPYGSLMQASDGKLYGMTSQGEGNGGLFQYDPLANIYIKKFDFNGALNGSYPYGSLIQASDGMLYGMTTQGGANNIGVLFQYNPVTNTYTKKLDFDDNNGSNPYGSLIQANDGMLYGMTQAGGASGAGVLFQYNPAANIYTNKFDFDNLVNGGQPQGSLIQASDGKLYGMTESGGSGNGVLFQYDPISSTYTKKLNFYGFHGQNPRGSLMQASDGMLYGMTKEGGASYGGVLFQYDPALNTYTKKFDFDGTNGYYPFGALMQASDGLLYGMATQGGTPGNGVFFQYNMTTNNLTKKLDFNGTNGNGPQYGNLIDITVSLTTSAIRTNNCAGSSISVPYITTGLYNAGNIFTAQLSDAAGSFASPVNIGTLASNSAAGTINALIPLNASLGTGYRIRVVSSNPAVTGKDNGSNISINPYLAVTASATPSPNVCAGSSVTLTGGGAVSYIWTGGITDAASFIPSSTATFTVTGTDGNGCTNTAVKTITVNTLPTVFAYAAGANVCAGTSVTLAGLGNAVSYTWTGGITDGIAFVPTSPSTVYTVTGTDGNGCTGTASKTITVNPVPTVTASASINTVCTGTSVTLTAGGTALNYSWSGGITDGAGFVPSSTNTYTLTGTDANGCTSIAVKTITVNPMPIVFAYATGTIVCAGTSVTLSGLGNASSYTWTGGVIDGDAFTPTAASTSYTVTGIDGNNCSSTASKTIMVLPTAASSQSPSVCAGHSIIVGNHTYNTSGTYTDVFTSFNGCDSTVTTHLTVNNVSVSVSSATLTANESGASYQWLNCSNGYAVIAGQTNQSYTTTAGGSYAVIVTHSSCSDTSACYVTTTGIVENDFANSVTIYPNPFTEQTTISFDSEQKNTLVKIMDVLGKEVKIVTLSGTKSLILEKGEMKAGIYFVQINTEQGTAVKKIIIN